MPDTGEAEKLNGETEAPEPETDQERGTYNNKELPSSTYSKRGRWWPRLRDTGLSAEWLRGRLPAIPSLDNSDRGSTPPASRSSRPSWMTGLLSTGSFVGCVIAGPIMERIGRKSPSCSSLGDHSLGFIITLAIFRNLIYARRFMNGVGQRAWCWPLCPSTS